MAIRKYRFEVPGAARAQPAANQPAPREDREPVRLRTSLTFSRTIPAIHSFRVLAEREEGPDALVCLGATREEVLACVRSQAAELPADTVQLRLEEWQGGTCMGRWQTRPCRRGELPLAPARRRPRRRLGRRQ